MYREKPLEQYVRDASSNKPAPGGGSVSALVGALGASMACMAANFTVGKKKYKDVEEEVREILTECEGGCAKLVALMDEDVAAYSTVSAAYAMPKDTPEQKQERTEAIQKALKVAMDVPLRSLGLCDAILARLPRLAEIGNPNLISDVGVAAVFCEAALRGSKLNVEINLAYLKDEGLVSETRAKIDAAAERAEALARDLVSKIAGQISGEGH